MPKNRDYTGLVRTPPSMAWLIRRKATLRGQLERIDRQLTEELPRKRLEVAQALAALDSVIPLHEVKVDPAKIKGVRPSRPALVPRGVLTRAILECLRKQGSEPVTTLEIAYYVARSANLDVRKVGRRELAIRVRRRLRALREDGLVDSFHDLNPSGIEEGRWTLRFQEPRKAA